MIRLILDPFLSATVYQFDQTSVSIGEGKSCHLPLQHCLLASPIVILEEEGAYFLLNPSGDPSVTLNGQMVSRQQLRFGDRIHIGDTELLFEAPFAPPAPAAAPDACDGEMLSDAQIDFLLAELEHETAAVPAEPPVSAPSRLRPPLPQEPFTPYVTVPAEDPPTAPLPLRRRGISRMQTAVAILCITLLCVFGLAALKKQNHAAEVGAARDLADSATALLFARLTQSRADAADLMNGGDMQQFKNAVVPPSYRANKPSEEQSRRSPYELKAIATSDRMRYLLFAIPKPTLVQRLYPKAHFLLDSKAMEVRKTYDAGAWTPLLEGREELDSYGPCDIAYLTGQAQIVPLSFLDDGDPDAGFSPPAALTELKPHLDYLIYNAPRYYPLSQPLYNQARQLAQEPSNDLLHIAHLLHTLRLYSSLSDFVIYSPDGIDGATIAWKELKRIAPQHGFLWGYLYKNGQTGPVLIKGFATEQEIADRNDAFEAFGVACDTPQTPCFDVKPLPSAALPGVYASLVDSQEEEALVQKAQTLAGFLSNRTQIWLQLLETEEKLCQLSRQTLETAFGSGGDSLLVRCEENGRQAQALLSPSKQEEASRDWSHVLMHARTLQSDCHFLQGHLQSYQSRLETLLDNLKKAKKESVFGHNRPHFVQLFKEVHKRQRLIQRALPHLATLLEGISASVRSQEEIALNQQGRPDGIAQVEPSHLDGVLWPTHNANPDMAKKTFAPF